MSMLYASGGATSGCIPAIPLLLYNSVEKETSIPIYTVYNNNNSTATTTTTATATSTNNNNNNNIYIYIYKSYNAQGSVWARTCKYMGVHFQFCIDIEP